MNKTAKGIAFWLFLVYNGGQWSVVSGQWSARTEGAYRSAFGGISRFRLVKAYRYRIYSVISLCEADISVVIV